MSPPSLIRYSVAGLFGSEKPRAFELDKASPTILTGSNGSGKSTILRSISAVGEMDLHALCVLPFEEISLTFSNGPALSIRRVDEGLLFRRDSLTWAFDSEIYGLRHRKAMKEADEAPAFRRGIARSQVKRRVAKEMFGSEKGEWLQRTLEDFPVLYISDQRLMVSRRTGRHPSALPRGEGPQVKAVNEFARELRDSITFAQRQYVTVSQELDEGFYRKVIDALDHPVEIENLRGLLADVTDAASRLRAVGLLGEERELAAKSDRLEAEAVRPVIKTFAEDTLRKYEVLMPLQKKLRVFIEFLDKHYRGKSVEIQQEKGFVIRLGDGKDDLLLPSELSSGEQQILTLAYQLVFKTRLGTLVLIDEPELSLHVNWQQSLIDDLSSLGQQQELSFLLATHSPTVIGDRPELIRSLDE